MPESHGPDSQRPRLLVASGRLVLWQESILLQPDLVYERASLSG